MEEVPMSPVQIVWECLWSLSVRPEHRVLITVHWANESRVGRLRGT